MILDTEIADTVFNWIDSETQAEKRVLKDAIKYHLLGEIIAGTKCETYSKRIGWFNLILQRPVEVAKRMLWFVLWEVKRLFLFGKKDVIISVFYKEIKIYSELLGNYLEQNKNIVIINFGMQYNKMLLLKRNYFCYPAAKNYLSHKSNNTNELIEEISLLFKKFKLTVPNAKVLEDKITAMIRLKVVFRDFIQKTEKKHNIKFLIQDIDYSYDRVIYSAEFPYLKVSLDHSIIYYPWLFNKCYSDVYLVWGLNQLEIIKKCDKQEKKAIYICGREGREKFSIIKGTENKKYWIIVLQSHEYALFQTMERKLEFVNRYINEICKVRDQIRESIEIIVSIHPNNNPSIIKEKNVRVINKNVLDYALQAELIFFEDTTIAIDLLKYEVPMIYIAGEKGGVFMNFSIAESDIIICKGIDYIKSCIEKANSVNVDVMSRKNIYSFYYSEPESSYADTLNKILLNNHLGRV